VWRWIFDHDRGPINSFLDLIGIRGPNWLLQGHTAFFAVIVVSIWFFTGYNMILFLAGLRRIPRELGEAAAVDGAGSFQRFRYITFPLLSPTTLVATVINTLIAFEVFGLIFVMTAGGPGVSTEVYLFRLWREAFEFFRIGSASAMGVILFFIMLILALIQFLLSKKWVFYE
jgi:ABC-type sugar transport system permease subunit